jgi:aminoglycoside phosphotransferase (APT) family kinase protein
LKNPHHIGREIRSNVPEELLELLRRDGVVRHERPALTAPTFTPLTDGVSSEIFRVDDCGQSFVVKRALPKLKVRDDWTADVDRNRVEQLCIEYVGRFLPDAVPRLLPGRKDRGYFAMEFLGPEFTSWKKLLLRAEASIDTSIEHATRAAKILGAIHAHSAGDAEAASLFATTPNFEQLRIEPYLLTTASRHRDLESMIRAEAQRLAAARICLVHGDFSPKNMMVSPSRFVLLDCEVAWYGDPAFDLAFLLTHLLLKGLYHASRQICLHEIGLHEMSRAFWQCYEEEVAASIDTRALESRVARLLPMLMLARVDGKSPVEYLTAPQQSEWVRRFTRAAILGAGVSLDELLAQWFTALNRFEARP